MYITYAYSEWETEGTERTVSENVIELNGKRYDARTGAYLGKSHVIPKHITDHVVHGKAIDGFVRPQAAKKTTIIAQEPARQMDDPKAKATTHSIDEMRSRIIVRGTGSQTRSHANHLTVHHPEHSKTLARHHLKKPQFVMKTAISKAHAPAEVMAKPQSAIAHKRSAYSVDLARQQRAALTGKHHTIKHFVAPAIHSVSAQVPVIAVQPVPVEPNVLPPARLPIRHQEDVFQKAIAQATSHQQPEHKIQRKRSGKRRVANSLAVIAAFLIIGGFVGYMNMPGIEMRIASVQAGFSASLPTYAPTGYALEGGVLRSGDTISVSFRSGASRYRVTQQSSNWDSQTLLDDTLAANSQYQTVQKNGQTIYIYRDGGTNAVWVNGGIRYDLTGNAELSKNEIVSIAASL